MGKEQALTDQEVVTAGLIIIGDEILSGRTKDQNIGYIADHLTSIGIELLEVRVIPDVHERIIETVNGMRPHYSYIFTTGGIGPTHDDLTAEAIAEAFGVGLDLDQRAVEMMRERYREDDMTEARLRMARIPVGADLINNSVSKAPGFWLENVIVMAGVPKIMQVMLDDVTKNLKVGKKRLSLSIRIDRPEGEVASCLGQIQLIYPDVAMGSYPFFRSGQLGTHLVLRSIDQKRLHEARAALTERLIKEGFLDHKAGHSP